MSKRQIKSFEDLECWKTCRQARQHLSLIIKKLPSHEKYSLADNMRRASGSITENIAEGYGRYHYGENIQFCRISRGSVYELMDQLITALDEGYISKEEYTSNRNLLEKAKGLLNGYINYLNRAKKNEYNVKEDTDVFYNYRLPISLNT
jgi:four helix bundle protein